MPKVTSSKKKGGSTSKSKNGKKSSTTTTNNNNTAGARADVFQALHAEMELADYATNQSGHKVKRVPRNQANARSAKRKALNDADMEEMAIEADDDEDVGVVNNGDKSSKRKRLRGSKVAFDDVVLKSMPAMRQAPKKSNDDNNGKGKDREMNVNNNDDNNDDDDEMIAAEGDERYEILQEVAALGIDLGEDESGEEEEDDDDDSNSEYVESSEEEEEQEEEEKEVKTKSKSSVKTKSRRAQTSISKNGSIVKKKKPVKMSKSRRKMHRLKDFTSQRLAEKHGEAIGAHIQGMSNTAVQKLREVAKAAPGAPQIYRSLGMVFESMVTDLHEEEEGNRSGGGKTSASPLEVLQRRMELAQKAYASYHIASLLTKRDFVLWERSGDAAIRVAELYSEIIDSNVTSNETLPNNTKTIGFDPSAGVKKWRSDRKLWTEHALSAYQASDNLRPPGVDIPCKLAQTQMALGNYIDALSILTDLRNKSSQKSSENEEAEESNDKEVVGRSEMEKSYSCWLLYADLMMKIGYECEQWNEGKSTNQHYMLKRWLRKHAKAFDWKERRLQALCLALEAAAGSASCVELVQWMRKRAEKYHVDIEKEDAVVDNGDDDDNNNDEDTNVSEMAKKSVGADKDDEAKKATYEEEREKLVNLNKIELEKHDRMTREMNLISGSHIHKDRIASRAALVEKHRTAMKEMALKKFVEDEQNGLTTNEEQSGVSEKPLPIQGSCATVYDIAALVLRQCIQLKLFNGGLLTVQCVLDYHKERVARHEKKIEQQRENELSLQSKGQGLVQAGFKYDQINFDSDDSDDEEGLGTFVSDDEDLDQPSVLQSLKSGMLPMDIRAMHAVCLLGNGGQDYVALNHVDQVVSSDEMALFSKDDVNRDAGVVNDDPQLAFSKYFTAPTNKSFLLACIANIVADNTKDQTRCLRVLGILRKHLAGIDSNQGKNKGLDDVLSADSKELDRVQTKRILLTALKLMIHCAKEDLAVLDGQSSSSKEDVKTVEKAVSDSIYTLETMMRFQLWKPSFSDWSLPQASKDMISILSGALSNLVDASSLCEEKSLVDLIQVGSMKARHLISTICMADNAPSNQKSTTNVESWRTFPLPFSWQNGFHEKISLRAYNMCVACCVSGFSGWEPSEFNLESLYSRDVNFFGITLEGACVAGFLPQSATTAVGEQWEDISSILKDMETLPFDLHLEERTKEGWYEKAMKIIEKDRIGDSISLYGEDDGISALLSFSKLSILAARSSEGVEKDELLKLSFSVLLPVTQFCIDKQVWQSSIGTSVVTSRNETKLGYYLGDNCDWLGPTKSKQGKTQYPSSNSNKNPKPTRPPRVPRQARKRLQPSSIVKVPTSTLLELWTQDDHRFERKEALQDAQVSMKKVDDAMKNLRKSRTLMSLERASIDVAVAMLATATFDECNNPFVCLQQAAMFAAMGSKRGNNDEVFKRFLPLKSRCSPLDALNILGRADCLRAIHFLKEAQYLCTWVASVCSSHRNELEGMPWNYRWQVIGISNYIIASSIDETGEALSQDNPDAGALRKWDDVAKKEFGRGKSDALLLTEVNPSTSQRAASAVANIGNRLLNGGGSMSIPSLGNEQLNHHQIEYQNESQMAVDNEDEYDPYAGVEVVGI